MIELLIIIICICILATQVYIQDWMSVIIFITILSLCHYVMKLDTYIAFGLAGILACLMNLFSRMRLESFSNEDDVADEDDEDDDDDDDDEDDEDDEEDDETMPEEGDAEDADDALAELVGQDAEEDGEHEHTFSHKHPPSNSTHEHFSSKSNPIDVNTTIKDALTNFDPKTLKNMTKDTTKLIREQSELMKTISQMQPIIEKGMGLLDKFQGDGKTEELFEKFAKLQKIKNRKK